MTDFLPPHDDIDLALEDIGAALGASGVHGLLAGLACSGVALPDAKLRALVADELDVDPDEDLWRELREVDAVLRRQLADDDLGFEVLLPDDDLPLADRVAAMAEWCDAFLAGFGTGSAGQREQDLPEDVRGLLSTFGEFSRAEVGADAEDAAAERDFMELVEYLRIGALSIFLEMTRPRGGGPATGVPVH